MCELIRNKICVPVQTKTLHQYCNEDRCCTKSVSSKPNMNPEVHVFNYLNLFFQRPHVPKHNFQQYWQREVREINADVIEHKLQNSEPIVTCGTDILKTRKMPVPKSMIALVKMWEKLINPLLCIAEEHPAMCWPNVQKVKVPKC